MSDQPQSVKSAQRTLELLEVIARHGDGVTFAELAEQLPYPKSSLHGLLQTVVSMKWLTFDPDDRRYSIGVRPWEVGQSFRRSRDLVIRARRYLREANEALDETVQLGILDDLDVVYLDKVEGTQPLRLVSNVGSRLPAYVTGIGKALLSGLPEETLRERFAGETLPGYTSRTITSGDRLIEVIDEARVQGFATDDGEYSHGVYCVAVPVRTTAGQVVAALSFSVPKARLESGDVDAQRMTDVLTAAAGEISAALASSSVEAAAGEGANR
ncbi:MAG: IclR family transcriptional regulator [Microbacterium sp.]|uniref:IclR family transcriptional regulator n=1 Tax=Microbacterium sp. TaxID=51671 RepID=UPI001AD36701|nr:IclR family transcriptional regulator [Microbacterium sp.]MBN9153515.1 IclR family transcriptional regulator [Microbacterium sp.]MBN9173830.1 IclR family transcriptional regulator [Microbacterium sp.]